MDEHRLTQCEAAELLNVCERQFRRQCRRYEDEGIEGLIDLRLGQVSSKRAPVDEVLRLAEQYRPRYEGWTVKHFYSKYLEQNGRVRTISCAWRCSGKGWGEGEAARRASAQSPAADRHDAAPGRLAACLAGGTAARSDCDLG